MTQTKMQDKPGLRDKAMLVSLSTAVWLNMASDSRVVGDIMKGTHTGRDVHKYKKILIKPEALTRVSSARNAVRRLWIENTLPWEEGRRLLPAARYQKFVEEARALQAEFDRAAQDFIREYPKMKAEARQRLGTLFRDEDFPTIEGIKSKFGCRFDFAPIPDGKDFRVSLSEDERADLEKSVRDSVKENLKGAMVSLVERLQQTVAVLAERMKETDPALRRTLVENIREVCAEVEAFNLLDDSRVSSFRKAAEALTKNVEIEVLKQDKKARTDLASRADDILAKMSSYIGAQT